jgi:pantoate--beta-alanine ligase
MWTASTIREVTALRKQISGQVAFVPTMGALHPGHASLFQAARTDGRPVIVSIFVNPTQFGPNEDFARYPRPVQDDLDLCRQAGVTGVFLPTVEQLYPPGQIDSHLTVPAIADILEGEHRPGHFAGVCRIVAKLFNIVQPDLAYFGRKDYQQLLVIESMVKDLHFPIQILGRPTLREPDGLAMSSRNIYLSPDQRQHAVAVSQALFKAKSIMEQNPHAPLDAAEHTMKQILIAHHFQVDYAVIRHPRTLLPLQPIDLMQHQAAVALIAARIGSVRLIDNMLSDSTSP